LGGTTWRRATGMPDAHSMPNRFLARDRTSGGDALVCRIGRLRVVRTIGTARCAIIVPVARRLGCSCASGVAIEDRPVVPDVVLSDFLEATFGFTLEKRWCHVRECSNVRSAGAACVSWPSSPSASPCSEAPPVVRARDPTDDLRDAPGEAEPGASAHHGVSPLGSMNRPETASSPSSAYLTGSFAPSSVVMKPWCPVRSVFTYPGLTEFTMILASRSSALS
jgi:hypothetical protein